MNTNPNAQINKKDYSIKDKEKEKDQLHHR
jgi:hypothetical protein